MTSTTRDNILWVVVNTCRLLVSATFVFSGVVKLIDPVGTQYKIGDYMSAFGISGMATSIWPLLFAIVLSLLEFLLGVYLFFGIRRRLTSWTLLIFMLLYTPLTFWLAWSDKVFDCGCFGDAIHLTNWQTFWKNALLLLMVIVIWWRGQRMTRFISESVQWIVSLFSLCYGLFVVAHCLNGEPVIDFRPYYVGQNIPAAMEWPDDPMQVPEILDFDIAPDVLADTSYTFLLISPHLELADDGSMDRINMAYDYAEAYGYRFLALTASGEEAIRRWQDLTGAEYSFSFMDELTLKTIARSNPALLLLHAGTIVAKWPANDIPDESQLTAPLHLLPLAHPQPENHHRSVMRLFLWYLVPLLLLTLLDRFVFSLRRWRRTLRTAKNN